MTVTATTTTPAFDGTTIHLGNETFVVPALTLGDVRKLLPKIQQLGDSSNGFDYFIDCAIEICGAAIRRNYPDLTNERLAELLDLRNLNSVVTAVMIESGLALSSKESAEGNSGAGSDSAS